MFNQSKLSFFIVLSFATLFVLQGESPHYPYLDRRPAFKVKVVKHEVSPPDEIREEMYINFFNFTETWVIKKKSEFIEMLKKAKVDPDTIELIKDYFEEKITLEHSLRIIPFMNTEFEEGEGVFIFARQSLKKRLPGFVLREIYLWFHRQDQGFPTIYTPGFLYQKKKLIEEIETWDASPREKSRFVESIIFINGKYSLPVTPDVWPYLSQKRKDSLINIFTSSAANSRKALKISLVIKNANDIEEAVERYSINSQHGKIIRRYLKRKLEKSSSDTIEISLEDLMQYFIRRNIYTFSKDSGPNCFNSGLCANKGRKYSIEYSSEKDLNKALKEDHVEVENQDLRVGDTLVYYDGNDDLTHVATYIDKDIVFTKNGLSKFNPYIFQYRQKMEDNYFPDKKFKLKVYRAKSNLVGSIYQCSAFL